jgi:hypothetical protein
VVGNLLFSGMVIRREDLNLKPASGASREPRCSGHSTTVVIFLDISVHLFD